jgi:hypothetical protein
MSVLTDLGTQGWERRDELRYEVRPLVPPDAAEHFGGKTLLDRYTRSGKVLALDCDTIAVAEFDALWQALDAAEFAVCRDVCPTLWAATENDIRFKPQNSPADMRDTIRLCGVDAPYFNGGVFAFRRTQRTADLFLKWHEEWRVYKRSNQYPLLRAMNRAGITPLELPSAFNADARDFGARNEAVAAGAKIVHFYGRSLDEMLGF